MNVWASTNAAAIAAAGLAAATKVSSWAIVVDVVTKKGVDYHALASYISDPTSVECIPFDKGDPPSAQLKEFNPAVGDAGDTWAIVVSTSGAFKPPAIRVG